jgi:hypothetical protein
MRIASNGEIVHDGFMPKENVLVERDFTISCEEVNYEIKARAVFVMRGFQPEEVGIYHLAFMSRGEAVQIWQPDKNLYSREQARKVAESAFDAGQVEAHAKREIQSWIYTGDVY